MSKKANLAAWAAFEQVLDAHVSVHHREQVRSAARALVKGHQRAALPKGGNDAIMTPDDLALAIARHFRPAGIVVDPCQGGKAFIRAFDTWSLDEGAAVTGVAGFDITMGEAFDFLTYSVPGKKWDWIITNPPWSKFKAFLEQAMKCANNVVFLDKMNAWGFSGRLRLLDEAGFGIVEKCRVKQPKKPWPQMGMQLAAVHIRRAYSGPCKLSSLDWTP